MTDKRAVGTSNNRYGPLSFAVAIAHVFVVDLVTWLFVLPLWPLVFVVLPVTLAYVGVSALIARASGRCGQIGRGMMVGSLSGPLSLLIFIPAFVIAHAIGPL
ncbi:hypothetical protein ACKUT9_17290 [Mycobacterium seoulense]|uniref:hypothetical protein n=1 Tax=Mycobacterium seoulense TaxID=386911 RepID=UPI003CEC0357